jgi:hypothetical protein
MNPITSNAKIFEIADLMRKVDQNGSDADLNLLEQELERLSSMEMLMVWLLGKLLEGRPVQISSDNPESSPRPPFDIGVIAKSSSVS